MPRLSIESGTHKEIVSFTEGQSLRDVLDATGLRVRTGCRGSGACGLCRVQIESGSVDEPTKNELLFLGEAEILEGIRLACQVMPRDDMRIRIKNPAPRSHWRKLVVDENPGGMELPPLPEEANYAGEPCFGVAIDLGTTNISLSLWDLGRGRRLSALFGLNPQVRYGSDVMTRLVSAESSKACAEEISRLAWDSIGDALLDMCGRDGYDLRRIKHVAVVGNTAMLALLTGKGGSLLLRPEYWSREIACEPPDAMGWFEEGNLSADTCVTVHQPLAGFVGSDLLSAVLSVRLTEAAAPSLLIDFGTNSEIALWDGSTLWVTSAAGGPAFEASGMRCGMPAESGAIYKIDGQNNGFEPTIHVIAGAEPKGLCGSGIVDLVAHLVRTGAIDHKGRFSAGQAEKSIAVTKGTPGLFLDLKDIDVFQRAKAAVGAGIRVLLRAAGMKGDALRRLCICGTFGKFLDVRNAQDIGLLPITSPRRVELWGNAALTGCELLLLSPGKSAYLASLRKKTRLLNLSLVSEFEDLFLESLYLQPMRGD